LNRRPPRQGRSTDVVPQAFAANLIAERRRDDKD
jgi:hypothetical protein